MAPFLEAKPPVVPLPGSPGAEAPKVTQGPYWGRNVRTPFGWGLCVSDDSSIPHLRVALDWRIQGRRRVPCSVRRTDISSASFCAAGQCVLTTYGSGVMLEFRPSDGMHLVQLWGPLGAGRNHAYLRASEFKAVIPAAVGLAVETPYGRGICRGYRMAAAGETTGTSSAADGCSQAAAPSAGQVIVELPWGRAYLAAECIKCPVAVALPLINRFLDHAGDLFKMHSGTLAGLRESLNGLGLEKLQEKLTATATDAMDSATKLWEEWEAKDDQTISDTLRLKADEVMNDPQMKSVIEAGIARLNLMVCKSEGFEGVWVGKDDSQPRCTVKDATIIWHWGEDSELEIWGNDQISTELSDEVHRASLKNKELHWTDGDVWVLSTPSAASDAKDADASPDAITALMGVDLDKIKSSLEDLRKVVGGDEITGDVEKAMSALKNIAGGDGQMQIILDQMEERRELLLAVREQLMQSKTGQVLAEGSDRLAAQFMKIQETDITPQLARVQMRSQRFLTRLTTDKKMKNKSYEVFTAVQSRLAKHWEDPANGGLEAWVTSVRERVVGKLTLHRAMLVESLGGLDLQHLDIRQLIASSWDPLALEAQLEHALVKAIMMSGIANSGTELLDRFESSEPVSQIPVVQQTYQGILAALDDLGLEVPAPVRSLLEAQAAGRASDVSAWQAAIVQSLDDDSLVQGASKMMEQGESMLAQIQELRSSTAVAKVLDHLDDDDIERQLLKHLHTLDPEKIMKTAESALANVDEREQLVSQLKDICLDFILKVLPAINIEKLSGHDNGCDWEINDISFSDFRFRKENVHISLGDFRRAGEEILRVSAWDISAHFRHLKVNVEQKSFPFVNAIGVADAMAEKMSVSLSFKLDQTATGEGGERLPRFVMSSRSVHMENLELWVGESNYSVIVNALSFLFADMLKDYACEKIISQLDEHTGVLITTLNTTIGTCMPLLKKLGWEIQLEAGADAADGPTDAEVAGSLCSAGHPEDIDWADPGRAFAVRV